MIRHSLAIAFATLVLVSSQLTGSLAIAGDTLVFEPSAEESNGKHIVLISGDEEYRSEESCSMLGKILSQHHGFKCTVLFAIDKETGYINPYQNDNIPGTEALNTADLCILATRWRELPDDQIRPIYDYMQAGKPFIAYRTATHAFKSGQFADFDWKNFGIQIVGENWHSHHGEHMVQGGRAIRVEANAQHPILQSVEDIYTPSDIYGVFNVDDQNATVLLRGQILKALDPAAPPIEGEKNDPMVPMAWLRNYEPQSGKVGQTFGTTAGASVDFRSEDLRRLIVNAAYFLTGQEILARADVSFVDPFEPTFYGFVDGETYLERKLKPEDFGLGKSTSTFPRSRLIFAP
ncbi:Trehalose utilisation [Neorhodopirellula lusitana]|uniref:Trehalose utilisation n=1 Tax=Neorhodopirellula lusitana TaxID=445327 RepID=A0ABY1QI82_9BACT|nr:ThuA domain-containing protein [Neorhodopirellula lusitana]SMP72204.1 Trehalose utilisation [Neorhodopirellula lusitana]